MPIYAYRCATCGHAQDVLQKMSDDVLTVCPACGASTYEKQVTAAGFQLKGSGWYVTDFRGGNTAAGSKDAKDAKEGAETKPGAKPAEGGDKAAAPAPAPANGAPAAAAPAAAPAPAPAAAAPPPSSGA
jgi:putative FmdB family regulatory protein